MSRITTLIALTCSLVVAGTAGAQTAPDRDAIVAAVNKFFAGMKARDTAMMSSTSMPGATMAYAAYRAGKTTTGGAMAATQAVNVAAMAEAADERLLASEVWQDGDIATVWGPYEIFLGAKQLHCGYDGFNMARVEGVWQFSSVIYSARPDDCDAIRAAAKGPPREPSATERAEVLKAVEGFFTAMRKKDSAALANSFTERANWTTAVHRAGRDSVSRRMASLDVGRMSKSKQALDERFIGKPTVRVDGDVALVWGYYQFKVDNKVTHCGYDSFHMLKENGTWKIESGAYTVRPDGCRK
jgi:hypothetical protein